MTSFTNYLKSRLLWRPPVEADPRELSKRHKLAILVCLALCGSTAGFASTIYFPGLPAITADFNAPAIATTLTAAFYVLFMGMAPVVWAALSDALRVRRFILLLAIIIFTAASIGAAFVNNIWGLLVLRIVQAIGASSGFSVGGVCNFTNFYVILFSLSIGSKLGIIADCYPIEERGAAFGKFYFGVFIGPLVGPILGGFLIMSPMSWRATFLFSFAFGAFIILCLFFTCPETFRDGQIWDNLKLPTISIVDSFDPKAYGLRVPEEDSLRRNSRHSMDSNTITHEEKKVAEEAEYAHASNDVHLKNSTAPSFEQPQHPLDAKTVVGTEKKMLSNPFAGVTLLRHPFILLSALVSSFAFGSMFTIESLIPGLFEENYGFISWQTGLSFLGAGVGNVIGSICQSGLSDRLLLRSRRLRGGVAEVEDRLTLNLWPASICVLFGCLLWGWSIESRMTYWAPIVGFGIMNFGMNQSMTATSAYIVDAVPGSAAAAASAASNLLRMVFACVLTIIAEPLNKAVGPGYTSLLLAALNLLGLLCLVVVKIWGPQMRKYSGYA
ncbi:major facilitator superfamily domain-containing protein [Mycotypha africana]|uniref:major facilitator superfamily domain-containing protein n=1 Tax=Mycotypha africana TaxID=64632 RepID=UPI002300F7A5|nr:major facilitator superfamily domain-containing protein [Mycotypha africana]KAI8975051.1 major facilitator superfamily domain-containing protein [Mycotypha africana]